MENHRFENRNAQAITMSADIYFPQGFDPARTYPAVVVTHPGGGVKEQTAGLYARHLADSGVIAVAFDASYQGESGGMPRQLENPAIRTEDVSAVIDYLTTLPYVDAQRIGAMGICAGGGYTVNAAINDPRIRAVATVSAVNIGQMFRQGWDNTQAVSVAQALLKMGADSRTQHAGQDEAAALPLAPLSAEEAPNAELREAWEYYRTARCAHPRSPSLMTVRSMNQLVTYDAYQFADLFLTQPLLMVAGSDAGSKWMSEDLMQRAATEDKQLHIVAGANHMSLYDVPVYVEQAVSSLTAFFQRTL